MQEITFLLYCVFIFTSFGSCFTMCVCVFIWCRISVVAGWRASSLTVWTGMTRFSTLITWNPVFPSTRCTWKRTTQLLSHGPHSGEQLLWIYVKLQSSVCPHLTCPVACWKAALDVRCFIYAGPAACNSLPRNIKLTNDTNRFKQLFSSLIYFMLLFDILLVPLDNLLATLYKSEFVFVNTPFWNDMLMGMLNPTHSLTHSFTRSLTHSLSGIRDNSVGKDVKYVAVVCSGWRFQQTVMVVIRW